MNGLRIALLKKILPYLIDGLVRYLTSDVFKGMVDKGLDYIEDYVEKTESEVDDQLLKVIAALRAVFDIPDND